jgi:hypothetical protein
MWGCRRGLQSQSDYSSGQKDQANNMGHGRSGIPALQVAIAEAAVTPAASISVRNDFALLPARIIAAHTA